MTVNDRTNPPDQTPTTAGEATTNDAMPNEATAKPFEIGLYSFVELTPNQATGELLAPEQRIRDFLEEVELADQVGLDVFGVGEHHRPDYVSSAPAVILAAAAARTKRIRLTSAVTVLSSDDPVRVFQQFSSLDLVSGGRAEIMAGRGSFIESFPLFGYDLQDYDELFDEKLRLLLKLRDEEVVSWQGGHRPAIDKLGVYPRPAQERLPVWVAVGGTPQSTVRAATLGLPMALAIIGGNPAQFAPYADLYRRAARQAGHDPANLGLSLNMHGYVAENSRQAGEDYYPAYSLMMNRIGRERGWPPLSREQFEASRSLHGANLVGTPDEIIERALHHYDIFGHDRFLLQISVGTLPHAQVLRAIELFGTEVAPVLRREIENRQRVRPESR